VEALLAGLPPPPKAWHKRFDHAKSAMDAPSQPAEFLRSEQSIGMTQSVVNNK